MKKSDKMAALAKFEGYDNLFVLMKRGFYYRPGARGYTNNLAEAGRYTEDEANTMVYPHDEPVTKHPFPPENYLHDHNLVHRLESKLIKTPILWNKYMAILATASDGQKYCGELVHRKAEDKCDAILMAAGLWVD